MSRIHVPSGYKLVQAGSTQAHLRESDVQAIYRSGSDVMVVLASGAQINFNRANLEEVERQVWGEAPATPSFEDTLRARDRERRQAESDVFGAAFDRAVASNPVVSGGFYTPDSEP